MCVKVWLLDEVTPVNDELNTTAPRPLPPAWINGSCMNVSVEHCRHFTHLTAQTGYWPCSRLDGKATALREQRHPAHFTHLTGISPAAGFVQAWRQSIDLLSSNNCCDQRIKLFNLLSRTVKRIRRSYSYERRFFCSTYVRACVRRNSGVS